jgi:hypothetical protein
MSAQHPAIVYDHESPRILVADVTSGQLWPAAYLDWLVLSNDHAPWQDSLLVEQYCGPRSRGQNLSHTPITSASASVHQAC